MSIPRTLLVLMGEVLNREVFAKVAKVPIAFLAAVLAALCA